MNELAADSVIECKLRVKDPRYSKCHQQQALSTFLVCLIDKIKSSLGKRSIKKILTTGTQRLWLLVINEIFKFI